jgi:hypothetical protein
MALLVLLSLVWFCCSGGMVQADSLMVEAVPLVLDQSAPERTRFGQLTFLGGFVLHSPDERFGGLSGLALSPDGAVLYAVSDYGYGLSVSLQHTADGRLAGFRDWNISRLINLQGKPFRAKADAEALVRDQDGAFLVAFEGRPRLWRYPPATPPFTALPQALPLPSELAQAPGNGGLEAVARLPDGRVLLVTEEFANTDGSLKGWLIDASHVSALAYQPFKDFRPTDLATLANGDVLVLERYYSILGGPAVRLRRLSREHVRAGAMLQGQEIMRLELPLSVDNFEGLAVHEAPPLGTLLYLVTDNNYSALQRTLLLQFRLEPSPLSLKPLEPGSSLVR